MMEYLQLQPPEYLKRHVQYLWTLENTKEDTLYSPFGPLADGCPGLIVQLTNPDSLFHLGQKQLPASFIYGQTIKFSELYLKGKFKIVGVCFFPNALSGVLKLSAHELTDNCLNLELLPEWEHSFAFEQLLTSTSGEEQIEIVCTFLFAQLKRNDFFVEQNTQLALNEIIRTKGKISLKELQRQIKLSERSFQRKFERHVGISPKLFSRVCRFQAALNQLKSNNYTKLSDVAFDNGYTDQPHFIRSFKEFTGYTPFEFQKKSADVVRISLY